MKCLSAIGTCHLDFELLCKRWEINTHTHTPLDAVEKRTAGGEESVPMLLPILTVGMYTCSWAALWSVPRTTKRQWCPEPGGTHAELGLKYRRHYHSLKGIKNTVWEGEGGTNWEIRTDTYTRPCVKEIASGKLLDNTGSSDQCPVTT